MESTKHKLDIRYSNDLSSSTTHYLKGAKNSSKLLFALLRQIPVVTEHFLFKLESLSEKLQDNWEENWPSERDFTPDVKFCPNKKRSSLFDGVSFVVCKKEDADFLDPLITLARGRCLYFPLGKGEPETQCSDLVDFIKSNENCVLVNLITDANALSFFKKTWGNAPGKDDEACASANKVIYDAARILEMEVVSNTELMESVVECDRQILFRKNNKRHLAPEGNATKRRLLSRRERGQVKALDTMDVLFFDQFQPSQKIETTAQESSARPVPSVSPPKSSVRKRPVLIRDSFLDDLTQNKQDVSQTEDKPLAPDSLPENHALDLESQPEKHVSEEHDSQPHASKENGSHPKENERRKFVFDNERIARELEEPKVDSQTALYNTLKRAQAIKTQQKGEPQLSQELTKEMVAAIHDMTIIEDIGLVRGRGLPASDEKGNWKGKKNFKCFRKVYPKHMGIENGGSRRINSLREFLSLDSHDVKDDVKRKLQDDHQFLDLSQDQDVPELDEQIAGKPRSALFVQSDEEREATGRRPALRSRIPAKRAKSPESDDESDDEQPRFRFKR